MTGLVVGKAARTYAPGLVSLFPATLTTNGAWTWYSDPRVFCYQGTSRKMYAGYLRKNGDVTVASVDLDTGTVVETVLHATLEVDDHDNPTMIVRPSDGRLIAFYTKHGNGSPVYVRVSTNPEDVSSWGAETTSLISVADVVGGNTYSNPFYTSSDGRLWLFGRSGVLPYVTYSDDGGATWSTSRFMFIERSSARPYMKYCSNGVDEIHCFATNGHPRDIPANQCSLYHWVIKRVAGVWGFYKTDGSFIRTLATLATTGQMTASEVSLVYDATTELLGNAWTMSIKLDATGKPVIAYLIDPDWTAETGSNDYYYARWTGSAWDKHQIATAQPRMPTDSAVEAQYTGTVSVDQRNTNRIWVGYYDGSQWEIQKWTTADGGATWAKVSITTGSATKNFRPVVPENWLTGAPDVAWVQGNTGSPWGGGYSSYTQFDTRIKLA
jgi:hypothetical protein